MVLELDPNCSAMARGAAALLLGVHVTAGIAGVGFGASAMMFRKGSSLHKRAGNWFFGSMLVMSGVGAAVAPFLPQPQWASVFAGVFTFYLVTTAWLTVRRRGVGIWEITTLAVAAAITLAFLAFGVAAARSPDGELSGQPYQAALVFGAVAALATIGDLRMVLRGGVSGVQRLVRHLWRMCVALFIACASFFLGQQQLFPAPLQGSFVLFVPELALLGLLAYWMVRVRIVRGGTPGSKLTAAAGQ
jgi:uncharacterized membrane protein